MESSKPYEITFSSIKNRLYVEKRKDAVADRYGLEIERSIIKLY